jgi:lipopolysaccharide/colanic/teichoic acid biosynthesis glycosyltransferase
MSSAYKSQPLPGSLIEGRSAGTGIPRPAEWLIAFLSLILLSPLLIVCSILVLISSNGPIFFCQQRVGRYGKVFRMFKFRTMRISSKGLLITAATDNRITPIGRFLRQWKLDELPELYNVLRGEMSFVGPRPEVPEFVDLDCPLWKFVLKVRPGITDPVTLTLRNEEEVLAQAEDKERYYRDIIQPYKLRGYIEYLEMKSVVRDLAIIVRTLKVMLLSRPEPRLLELLDPSLLD